MLAGEIKGLGAYSQYTIADEKIAYKLSSGSDQAAASTIPLAVTTAWLTMFSKGCLDMTRDAGQSILIWGGSCRSNTDANRIYANKKILASVGQYAIQIAALYQMNVVTTCSPRNFDLVKKLGASHAFDYNAADVVESIRKAAPDLKYIFDTIGNTESSAKACEGADANSALCTVRPGKANTEDVPKTVKVTDVLVWTAFLKDHAFGKFKWPVSHVTVISITFC